MSISKWRRASLEELLPLLEVWLARNFPTPYPVRVRYAHKLKYEGEACSGLCYREGRKIEIVVKWVKSREVMIDTLIHEWAHARNLRHDSLEKREPRDHTPEWGITYAAIISALFDGGGQSEVVE